MNIPIFLVLGALIALSSGVPPSTTPREHLLGAKECTWGPSYWCQNLTAAAGCHATKHCIQTVWVHKELPPDTSNICQTCKEMVTEARDQLKSNESQELLKEVFEGTCALIHLKVLVDECDKLVDNYIPDLIDTLASEMNPQVVCSVAGLCNNEKLQQAIMEAEIATPDQLDNPRYQCQQVVPVMKEKFEQATREEVRNGFLEFCRDLSSFSDSCSNIIIRYFEDIYRHLQDNLNVRNVCGLFSTAAYHQMEVEVMPESHNGFMQVQSPKDDLPCEFCQQLVGHLRDLLTANTTEEEFKKVLEGLCRQTGSFSSECLDLADQYYDIVYNYLIQELNASAVCIQIGICPRPGNYVAPPLMPLLTSESVDILKSSVMESTARPLTRVHIGGGGVNVRPLQRPEDMQLPIERMMPPQLQVYNSQTCVLCEYVMHYVQKVITDPSSEKEIEDALEKVCSELPGSVNSTCTEFVSTYGDAVIALLAQEIDPTTVCPLIRACPASNMQEIEVFMQYPTQDSKCPLCLFAVTKLEEMVKDQKTEENIKNALDRLCAELPNDLAGECKDFVDTYSKELVELLVADLNPQEVCVYLKLCKDNSPRQTSPASFGGDIETNMIFDDTFNGKLVEKPVDKGPQCIICEFVMKEIEDQLNNTTNEDEIMKIVHDICSVLPHTVEKECNDFVNQYGDTVIQLLIQALEPAEICSVIKLCESDDFTVFALHEEVRNCAVCEALTAAMDKVLSNPRVSHSMPRVLQKGCTALPEEDLERCQKITDDHGYTLYNWVTSNIDKHLVCVHVNLCGQEPTRPQVELVGGNPCTRGPGYWCISEREANECGALKHCQENVWFSSTKP